MLVVLSGAETIKKTTLANIVDTTLNNLTPPTTGTVDDFNRWLLDRRVASHYKMQFRSIMHDHGITNGPLYPEGGDYEAFLNTYLNRKEPVYVASGSFSKTFLNQLKTDIGDLTVINITRNPSVAYFLDSIYLDQYGAYDESSLNIKLLKLRFITSVINSGLLKSLDFVTTIKFEDLINQGYLEVNGTKISLSNDYTPHNHILTKHEKHHVISKASINAVDVERFNQVYSNLSQSLIDSRPELPSELFLQMPTNMFTELDYMPLTYNEIVHE